MKKHLLNTTFILLGLLIFIWSCNDDPPTPIPAPGIPPKSTMVIDFEDFTDQDTSSYKAGDSYQHWGWAATNVGFWHTAVSLTMIVPIASFQEAFNHEAVYDPDSESWKWSYNFWAAGALHLAELHASLVNEGVLWEMYISKNNHYSNFLWYSGISNTTSTSGFWELNKDPDNPTDFLYIEWNRDLTDETGDVKYTNVIPGDEGNGSYIHYGKGR